LPYYDEIELGDEIGPVEKVATDEEVASFCDVWGKTLSQFGLFVSYDRSSVYQSSCHPATLCPKSGCAGHSRLAKDSWTSATTWPS